MAVDGDLLIEGINCQGRTSRKGKIFAQAYTQIETEFADKVGIFIIIPFASYELFVAKLGT